ncbi:MAG: dethiobiotin synthase [Cytophagales bacterium]|nr:MAG: dethiobiotin synthase [Cytophagales bacterium]
MKKYFVTAIGTDCGKTLASAILCESLGFDYWKPVQSGILERDSEKVKSLVDNTNVFIHPEKFLLETPVSPHQSAFIDRTYIDLKDFELPKTQNSLIIEGAGGVLVPLNFDGSFVIDIAQKFNCEIILVVSLYLGSINHTLLTIKELKQRGLVLKGIIFNGLSNNYSEQLILKYVNCKLLLHINKEEEITKEIVKKYAKILKW